MSRRLENQHIYHQPWDGKSEGDNVEINGNLYTILSIEDPGMQLGDPDDTTTTIIVEEVQSYDDDDERTDI